MTLALQNLDTLTRSFMLEEFERDFTGGVLYLSDRLTETGRNIYPRLLREAIESGDDTSLATEIRRLNCLKAVEPRRTPSGGVTTARVPVNAHETLAEGEFNRFYIRALCRRVLGEGGQLEIYRAKPVSSPRAESQARIGQIVQDPRRLLEDLRTNIGVEPALGLPPGPNSGLSVKLKQDKED